jgi:hypothetical protein
MPRIYVDFNSMMRDPQERVELGQVGTWQGDRLPSLCVGDQIMLFDEEMEVIGTVAYDQEHHLWLAIPDWSTRRDLAA